MEAASRFDYESSPTQPGLLRAYGLALLMHAGLLAALTWGVSWHRDDHSMAVEAELWSALPQEAAPKAVEPEPQPEPTPPPPAPPKVEAPSTSEADIVRERERQRQQREQAEQAQRDKQRLERERQEKIERDKREQQEREKKLAEEKKKKELEAKRKEQQETELRDRLRKENLQRMAGLAGATGNATAKGNATQTSGPSSGYAARIRARIKPNIVFADEVSGNPDAQVEVRTSPDGTIVGRKLIKSSGVSSWDEAVLKAIDKTEVLPRDVDGTVWTPMIITFKPKD